MESIGSNIDNLFNFLLFVYSPSFDCSLPIVRIVSVETGVDENDGERKFGKFPFGRFKLLLFCGCCCCCWLDISTEADRSLGVSKEIDDGIWWILNAELFWSNFVGPAC